MELETALLKLVWHVESLVNQAQRQISGNYPSHENKEICVKIAKCQASYNIKSCPNFENKWAENKVKLITELAESSPTRPFASTRSVQQNNVLKS